MGENARFKNGHARAETRVLKTDTRVSKLFLDLFLSNGRQRVGVFKNARVEKNAFKHTRIQWNAGTACVSECVLKNASVSGFACRPF